MGHAPDEFVAYYEVLKRAQEAAVLGVRPGVTAESASTGRRGRSSRSRPGTVSGSSTAPGTGSAWKSHEDPYIVEGNELVLDVGMAFSVEPGIYPGPHGARIEDIVVCADPVAAGAGMLRMNNLSRDLLIV